MHKITRNTLKWGCAFFYAPNRSKGRSTGWRDKHWLSWQALTQLASTDWNGTVDTFKPKRDIKNEWQTKIFVYFCNFRNYYNLSRYSTMLSFGLPFHTVSKVLLNFQKVFFGIWNIFGFLWKIACGTEKIVSDWKMIIRMAFLFSCLPKFFLFYFFAWFLFFSTKFVQFLTTGVRDAEN